MEIVKGGPTKFEIAAVSLSKLHLTKNDVFADIGCGTGCISIMASPLAAEVYAIDSREEAINATRQNVGSAAVTNITIIHGEAPSALDALPPLDRAFIGGTRNIIGVLEQLAEKVQGRIVVNAVRLQTAATIIRTMQDMKIFEEAVHVQVAKSYPLADDIAFKPINPVYIIVGDTAKGAP